MILVSLTLFVSCGEEKETMNPIEINGGTALSIKDMVFHPAGQKVSVSFTATSAWVMKNCPAWLSANRKSGSAGTTVIELKADINADGQLRKAELEFSATNGKFRDSLVISQPMPYLAVDQSKIEFEWDHSQANVEKEPKKLGISSNLDWIIRKSKEGGDEDIDFNIATTKGHKDFALEVIPVLDNFSRAKYLANLELVPVYYDEMGTMHDIDLNVVPIQKIALSQKNLRFLIDNDARDINIELSELNDDNLSKEIDAEVEWSLEAAPDWVVLDKTSGSGIQRVGIKAKSANPDRVMREGDIVLATKVGAKRKLHITQRPYVFNLKAVSVDFKNNDTRELILDLETTGTWIVKDIPEWLSVLPSMCDKTTTQSGKDHYRICLSVAKQNLEEVDLNDLIKVSSSMNMLSETVSVGQKGYDFDLVYDPKLQDLPTMNNSKYAVQLLSSGDWQFEQIPDWVEVSKVSDGAGDWNFTVGPKTGNPHMDSDRTAILKLVSLNHKQAGRSLERALKIKQRKFTFEVESEGNYNFGAWYNSAKTFSVVVKCSSDWQIESMPEWLSVNTMSGDGFNDAQLQFTVESNAALSPRSGAVTFLSAFNKQKLSFNVAQKEFEFNSDKESHAAINEYKPQELSANVQISENAPWTVESDSWIKPNVTSGYGSARLTFTIDNNLDFTPRSGRVTILSGANLLSKIITFDQKPFVFNSENLKYDYTELQDTGNDFNVVCSGPWKVEGAPAWLVFNQNSGTGDMILNVKAKHNVDLKPRSVTFYVSSTLHSNVNKAVTINQEAYIYDQTPLSYHFATLEQRSETINLKSSGKWSVKQVPAWVKFSAMSGAGNQTDGSVVPITLTSTENLTLEDRRATVRIVSNDNSALYKEITLAQDKFVWGLDVTELNYTRPFDTSAKTINVQCSANWSVKSNAAWLIADVAEGSGSKAFTIHPEKNFTLSERVGEITVTSLKNGLQKKVRVRQAPYLFDTATKSLSFKSLDKLSQTVNFKSSGAWTVKNAPEWIVVTPMSGAGEQMGATQTISIVCKDNLTEAERNAELRVVANDNPEIFKIIKVKQEKFHFAVGATQIQFKHAFDSSNQSLSITCDDAWAFEGVPSWLTITPASGAGNASVVLSAAHNTATEVRTATIVLRSVVNNLTRQITISQSDYKFDTQAVTLQQKSTENDWYSLKFACTGRWKVQNAPSWIVFDAVSGSPSNPAIPDQILKLKAQDNGTYEKRSATFAIVSMDNASLQKTVTVHQDQFHFDLNPTLVAFAHAVDASSKLVQITCDGAWSLTSIPEWVKVNSVSGKGNKSVSISVTTNTETMDRAATIVVNSSASADSRKIEIRQPGYVFDTTATTVQQEAQGNVWYNVNFTCTGRWKVEGAPEWITLDKTSGQSANPASPAQVLKLKAQDNLKKPAPEAASEKGEPRNASFRIVSVDNPAFVKTITVKQK